MRWERRPFLVGLPEVRRAEAQKISQPATKVFIFQVEKFFAGQQAGNMPDGRNNLWTLPFKTLGHY